jgi:hypothetical protein
MHMSNYTMGIAGHAQSSDIRAFISRLRVFGLAGLQGQHSSLSGSLSFRGAKTSL